MANKAYKFRLYPTPLQEQLPAKTFGYVRFVYNEILAERKETYEQFKDDKKFQQPHPMWSFFKSISVYHKLHE
ncbi:transposase, IS605 family [Paenibacillus larvae subsp. larvae]|nr:transposase, IS605 family [Paenibacillus larvae subsp. larvae]AVG11027.1 transposase, IS605 family [Paenibacillus larvae subsp. larvae DSM 25430]ETK28622.1 transposase, IS605 family [Paenibacillus larvae subsp. larvae DSM 25719]MBH0341591.1 transposase [Paenibacillus larvae]AVF28328.1 transposase, IS605 family [Paenibacillus larvae subsp. larvae]